jgi:uncharacterized protein (DUF433 family)
MATAATDCAHIELRDGVPYIAGTVTKVRMVALNHLAFGWDGKELQEQMPHLTLGQIYAALSYYHDHKDAIDADIDEGERMAETLRPTLESPRARADLLKRIAALRGAGHDPA